MLVATPTPEIPESSETVVLAVEAVAAEWVLFGIAAALETRSAKLHWS